jgi:hypothetical protein
VLCGGVGGGMREGRGGKEGKSAIWKMNFWPIIKV